MSADLIRAREKTIRDCITWLHVRAAEMNDPHAKGVLNSAAFDLGRDRLSAPVQEGWRLVPVEADEKLIVAMATAYETSICFDPCGAMEDAYRAMLAAAPPPPSDRGEGDV